MPKWICVIILVANCFVCAFSQVLLKKASQKEYSSFLRQYLNWQVILGYVLFAVVVFVNVFLLRYLLISVANPVCEALPILLSFFTGRFFFGEKFSVYKIVGGILMLSGIVIVLV